MYPDSPSGTPKQPPPHRLRDAALLALAIAGGASIAYAALPATHAGAPIVRRAERPPETSSGAPRRPAQQEDVGADRSTPPPSAQPMRVRLRLGPWTLDVYAFAVFMVVLGLQLAGQRGSSELRTRLDNWLFWCATLGLAGAIWAWREVGFRLHLVAWDYRIATYTIVAIFCIASTSDRTSPLQLLRHSVGDVRAIFRIGPTWVASGAMAAFILVQPAPRATSNLPTGDRFDEWFRAQVPVPELTSTGRITIVKVNDYQCPPCRRAEAEFAPVIRRLTEERPGAIVFRTIDYPSDPECNPFAQVERHVAGCEAAVVVRLAERVGRRQAMEDWLWENQSLLSPQAVLEAGVKVGQVPDLAAAYRAVLDEIRVDSERAYSLKVVGTPTYFVNGIRLQPGLPAAEFERAIRHELTKLAR